MTVMTVMTVTNVNHLATNMNIFNKIYNSLPAFDDVFDEQTFYLFALIVTFSTIIVVLILSRFIVLKEVNY